MVGCCEFSGKKMNNERCQRWETIQEGGMTEMEGLFIKEERKRGGGGSNEKKCVWQLLDDNYALNIQSKTKFYETISLRNVFYKWPIK